MITYRHAKTGDEQLLQTFLYHAIYIPEGCEPPSVDIVFTEDFIQYTEAFGINPQELGIIAEDDGKPVGAAWIRLIN